MRQPHARHLYFSKSLGYTPTLLESTHKVNQEQPLKILELLESALGDIEGKTVAILGISFKKNTDDVREAVSIRIIENLIGKKVNVKAHDPMAIENCRKIFGDKIEYFTNIQNCLDE